MPVASSITTPDTEVVTQFPALMLDPADGSVLLMSALRSGMVVHQGKGPDKIGHEYTALDGRVTRRLQKFTGTVTLENPK